MLKGAYELWYIYLMRGLASAVFMPSRSSFGVVGAALSKWTSRWRWVWVCWVVTLVFARVVCAVPECWGSMLNAGIVISPLPSHHPFRVGNLNFIPLVLMEALIYRWRPVYGNPCMLPL